MEFSQQFSLLYMIIILFVLFIYLSISVFPYSRVLSSKLVCGDCVILFFCFLSVFYLKWSVNIYSYIKKPLKTKTRSGTSLPGSFSSWLLNKNISLDKFYQLAKFHCLLASTLWDIGQYVYCVLGFDVINSETNLIFLIKWFSLHHQNVKTKN